MYTNLEKMFAYSKTLTFWWRPKMEKGEGKKKHINNFHPIKKLENVLLFILKKDINSHAIGHWARSRWGSSVDAQWLWLRQNLSGHCSFLHFLGQFVDNSFQLAVNLETTEK